MKKVQDIYIEYKIMHPLRLHQLRVASVAKVICDSFQGRVDTKNVVLACLFHDMGNIIKSDLARFPDFLEPEGFDYWQNVKNDYVQKYGNDEHVATEAIASEIGLPIEALGLLKQIGFSNLGNVQTLGTYENKICSYADMRVGPYGMLSIEDRLSEARKRYEGRIHSIMTDSFEPHANSLRSIEADIFSKISIKPEDIQDENIKNIMEDLVLNFNF